MLKWYRKIAFDFILSTATVNVHYLFFKSITGNTSITITSFKEQIFKALIYFITKRNTLRPVTQSVRHRLVRREKEK